MKNGLLLLLVCILTPCASYGAEVPSAPTAPAAPTLGYRWSSEQVYRFHFHKKIVVHRVTDKYKQCQEAWTRLQSEWSSNSTAKAEAFKYMLSKGDDNDNKKLTSSEGSRGLGKLLRNPETGETLMDELIDSFDADGDASLDETEWNNAQAAATLPNPDRTTDLTGVLVLKVDAVAADGTAMGVLSFDSPRLELPVFRDYDKKTYQIQELPARSTQIQQSMEELLRRILWKVKIGADGNVLLTARDPDNLKDYAAKIAKANSAKKGYGATLEAVLTKDLNLNCGTPDSTLLLVLPLKAPEPLPVPTNPWEKLFPRRRVGPPHDLPDQRVEFALERTLPGNEPVEVQAPKLSETEPPVYIQCAPLTTLKGRAVFDLNTGLLDELIEEYRTDLTLRIVKQQTTQTTTITYELRRILPGIRGEKVKEEE